MVRDRHFARWQIHPLTRSREIAKMDRANDGQLMLIESLPTGIVMPRAGHNTTRSPFRQTTR